LDEPTDLKDELGESLAELSRLSLIEFDAHLHPALHRREKEREELFYAAKLYESHIKQNTPEPYDPAAHGFVITLAQVEAYALRDKVKELARAAA
jgi:hypothetical protein